jgi:4-amino-4-deoxy-L-arabinose transferase-like glycosyltransferase
VQRALPSIILLLIVSFGSVFFRLGSLPLSGSDEPRYARIAQEMHKSNVWITPTLEGKPWLEKPPLYYWIASPFYSLFRNPETAARIGPAICTTITAMAIFWLGSMLWSSQAGLLGSLILLTSLGFVGFGRSASTDMPFTCVLTLALAILVAAVEKNMGWKVMGAYVLLGLAVLGKGPVAIVLAAGIGIFTWLLIEREGLLRRWHILPGIIVTAAVSIPWFWLVFRGNGYGFISTFFINHNLARYITDIHHHSQPFYYFVPVLLALLFPWTGWLWLLISKSPLEGFRRWRQWPPGMVFLACWALVPLIFFSLSESKLAGYILPSLPPLTLILGVCLSRWIENACKPPRLRAAMVLHLIVSVAMAVATPIYFQKDYGGNWKIGLLLSTAMLIPALYAFGSGLKGNCSRAFKATVLQGLVLVLAIAQFAFPVLGAYHSTRDIAHRAMESQKAEEPLITFHFFHHSFHFYTNYGVAADLKESESVLRSARTHPSVLVATTIAGAQMLSDIEELRIDPIAEQGNFRLLRISSHNPPLPLPNSKQ